MADKHWIQAATEKMNQHGTIGSFSAAAKRNHLGTQAYASKVLSDSHASESLKKKANFARNVAK